MMRRCAGCGEEVLPLEGIGWVCVNEHCRLFDGPVVYEAEEITPRSPPASSIESRTGQSTIPPPPKKAE